MQLTKIDLTILNINPTVVTILDKLDLLPISVTNVTASQTQAQASMATSEKYLLKPIYEILDSLEFDQNGNLAAFFTNGMTDITGMEVRVEILHFEDMILTNYGATGLTIEHDIATGVISDGVYQFNSSEGTVTRTFDNGICTSQLIITDDEKIAFKTEVKPKKTVTTRKQNGKCRVIAEEFDKTPYIHIRRVYGEDGQFSTHSLESSKDGLPLIDKIYANTESTNIQYRYVYNSTDAGHIVNLVEEESGIAISSIVILDTTMFK